jgi:predicted TIM-barrel fold metal-dependent hydrolase
VIVDSHAHIFPFLGGASGYSSVREHLLYLQRHLARPVQVVRRVADDAEQPTPNLWDDRDPGPGGARPVGFHVGRYGRFQWTLEGVEQYVNFMPPHLQGNEAPSELLLAEMAHAGVEMAVLQNAHLYGRLNEYFADAVQRHPGKLIALAEVQEHRAHEDDELRRLRRAARELGLRGLYYANRGLYFEGYRHHFDDDRFGPLWEEVRSLGLVVFWEVAGIPVQTEATYREEVLRLRRWAERFPGVRCVWTHGLPHRLFETSRGQELLEVAFGIVRRPGWHLEVLYPIHYGAEADYPYPGLRPVVRTLYEALGPERLVWGSDTPNVGRNCTYSQSLRYLTDYCDFVPPAHMDLIVGGNVARLFDLLPAGTGG